MNEAIRGQLRSIPVFADLPAAEFREKDLPDNPIPMIAEWILAAHAAGQPEPHAMSLCTVGPAGVPSSRVLLVKDIDDRQLYFVTPASSRKGLEITANPHVAAHFYWPATGQQVRGVGTAAEQDRAASERDFAERNRSSRLAARLTGRDRSPAGTAHWPSSCASARSTPARCRVRRTGPCTPSPPPRWSSGRRVPTGSTTGRCTAGMRPGRAAGATNRCGREAARSRGRAVAA